MADQAIYCIYISNNKYTAGLATWYQTEAFNAAEEFFKNSNVNTIFKYNNRGYIFDLKNHTYAYEMIKESDPLNKFNQYLANGEENKNILLSEIKHPPEVHPTIPCPICDKPRMFSARYPKAVCNTCSRKTKTINGDTIEFYNTSICGGFEGRVNGVITHDGTCYIEGKKCWADEARFGGIVVQCNE